VLYGLWGDAKNDLYMVGSQGNILHYDGEDWESSGLFTTSDIRGVWGTSGDNVYVVGDGGSIQHYDGKKWSFMSSNTPNQLYGVWGTSEHDIFAVGSYGTIIHYGELNSQPSATQNQSPSLSTTTPVKQGVPEPHPINKGLIVGIAGALVVAVGVTWFALSRRAKKTASK
jgi:hypothetical protein